VMTGLGNLDVEAHNVEAMHLSGWHNRSMRT
jgi:hypothetical protein